MALIFPYIGKINPTDFHIFQRGRYTINQDIIPVPVHTMVICYVMFMLQSMAE